MRWHEGSLEFIGWVNQHNPEKGVRIFGVLQRIAVCYFFASVIVYYLKPKAAWLFSLLFLLLYWVICVLGNPADPFSLNSWIGTDIDKAILHIPHMYKGEGIPFDPEGLLSTIPAIVEVVLGFFIGTYIKNNAVLVEPNAIYKMLTGLFITGITLLITGLCWDMVFPINKKYGPAPIPFILLDLLLLL
ncbi:hypothetical protein [Niabella ginsengisoli]|uniref:Uncharacterized protein n=1 Tax=Niabella ginsengisoli TaxID=522298 RepID=A0ABS9SEB3_9BACT|nr:hypothetical protein [Niabella ginsengisoli]MCH5596524.1 hypothetical protein [Niabella ginsengisoli]